MQKNYILVGVVVLAILGLLAINYLNREDSETTSTQDQLDETTQTDGMQSDPVFEETPQTILDVATNNPEFSVLVTAVTVAGLEDELSGEGPFTVFAPINSAFEDLPAGTLELLLDDTSELSEVVLYHVVSGLVFSPDAIALGELETLQGGNLAIELDENGQIMVNGANVLIRDVEASNGVIHVIDAVLLP